MVVQAGDVRRLAYALEYLHANHGLRVTMGETACRATIPPLHMEAYGHLLPG